MAQDGTKEGGGNNSIFDLLDASPFFKDGGSASEIGGIDHEIPVIEPNPTETRGTGTGDSDASGSSGGNTGTIGGRKPRADKGRPRGPRSGTAKNPTHLGGWEDALLAVHIALAGVSHCPELELDEDEARKVTVALDRLAGHYNVVPSETAKVWINFAGAIGSVYGPRAIAIKKRLDREAANRGNKVVNFPGP